MVVLRHFSTFVNSAFIPYYFWLQAPLLLLILFGALGLAYQDGKIEAQQVFGQDEHH